MGRSKKNNPKPEAPPLSGDFEDSTAATAEEVDREIDALRRRIKELEERKAAVEFAKTPLCQHLRTVQTALEKAVAEMDGRANLLEGDFIRASRQYHSLLERAIEQALGKRRRGRKPKSDLTS